MGFHVIHLTPPGDAVRGSSNTLPALHSVADGFSDRDGERRAQIAEARNGMAFRRWGQEGGDVLLDGVGVADKVILGRGGHASLLD